MIKTCTKTLGRILNVDYLFPDHEAFDIVICEYIVSMIVNIFVNVFVNVLYLAKLVDFYQANRFMKQN